MYDQPTNAIMVGVGLMARHHINKILTHFTHTNFVAVCEPSAAAYAQARTVFEQNGRLLPPNQPDLQKLLTEYDGQLDAAFVITPHKYHHNQAVACLQAGLDVLLEKPMVMTAEEAHSLIRTRDETGRTLVVAFQGSLSPEVRMADKMIRAGMIGTVRTINAQVWQHWSEISTDTWRVVPEISGGGFLFDTGAHMLNTVADLAGEPFVEVAAWLDNRGLDVDINGVVIGRLRSGAMVTLNACGEAFPSCESEVRIVGSKGMLRTGVWGRFLEVIYQGGDPWTAVPVPPSRGVWEQFQAVRQGRISNPSPPEVGLRMAYLWDAIRASAAKQGQPVTIAS